MAKNQNEPPEEEWAKTAINNACRILCLLYDGASRSEVFNLANELKEDIRSECKYVNKETGATFRSTNLKILSECRDIKAEEASERTYRKGYLHGYSHACDYIEQSKNAKEIIEHANKILDWSMRVPEGTLPPKIS